MTMQLDRYNEDLQVTNTKEEHTQKQNIESTKNYFALKAW